MEWSKDNLLKLIEEYRKNECLWNHQIPSYKDRQKRGDAWKEIGNVFGCEWIEIEKKMKTLIGQLQRELKKIKGTSGDGVDEDGNTKWFAFKSLLFLRDKWTPHRTAEIGVDIESKSNDEESVDATDSASQSTYELDSGQFNNIPEKQFFKSPVKKKRKSQTKIDLIGDKNIVTEAYDVMKSLQAKCNIKDDNQVYGDYVASKLRMLNETARNRVQHKINDILYLACEGAYDSPLYSSTINNPNEDLISPQTDDFQYQHQHSENENTDLGDQTFHALRAALQATDDEMLHV